MNNSLGISYDSLAIVVGSSGGLGKAFYSTLSKNNYFSEVIGFHRNSAIPLDITKESSVMRVSNTIFNESKRIGLFIDATGFLSDSFFKPEKSYLKLDSNYMNKCFNINTIGPSLLIKHFIPLMLKEKKSIFMTLSARVGSIEDNYLGGWHSYRASKAALNQVIKTTSIELHRNKRSTVCISVHPGTVKTELSKDFIKSNNKLLTPHSSVEKILSQLVNLTINDSGKFIDYNGKSIPF